MDEQAAQHADELMRQQATIEALKRARAAGAKDEDLMILAHECGVANDFYREIRL